MQIVLLFLAVLHLGAAQVNHPIDCVKNPAETKCVYKLND